MSQFDVYINPSKTSREAYPYFVDIQNSLINDIDSRLVIPLGKLSDFRNQLMTGLTPLITYEGEDFILLTPQLTSMPANLLKTPIGSLKQVRDVIISAIDFAITGI
jgi:toxin CcdB